MSHRNAKKKQGVSNLPKDSDLIMYSLLLAAFMVKRVIEHIPILPSPFCSTADDLVALFAWLIVHTGVIHLYSELDFISAFMEEGLFTGDGAYSLTTLQVQFILHAHVLVS
jgi:hypothetical protein